MLQAGFLSRAVMKDSELSPALKVVERIHTNHFLSVPDHQLNETKSEKEWERGEREREREGGGGGKKRKREICDPTLQRLKIQSWMASYMQKIISQQPPIRPTPDEPQAPPLADATKLLKQLDKAKVAIPNKAQSLSEFSSFSQRQSIRATPEESQAPPFAETQILPRQLDKSSGSGQVRPSFCLEHPTSF